MRISGINQALTVRQRVIAIDAAKKQFNHSFIEQHDEEIQAGAANALCLQLGYALNKKKDKDIKIINSICHTFVMIYHCSIMCRKESYDAIGFDLILLLIKSLERCKITKNDFKEEIMDTILHILQIIHLISDIEAASIFMATNRSVLGALVDIIQSNFLDSVKLEAISTFKNISSHAEEHRLNLVEEPLFISSIVELSYHSSSDKIREDTSETIRNLALAQDAKTPMALQGILLNALINLTDDTNQSTKMNAVVTLGSLAIPPENSFWLVSHAEGALVEVIFRLGTDPNPKIQERALKTLKRIGRGESIRVLVDRKHFLSNLNSLLLLNSNTKVQIETAEIIASFLSYLNKDNCPQLEKAIQFTIDIIAHLDNITCLEILFKTFMELSTNARISPLMMKHSDLLPTVAKILVFESQPKSTIYYILKTIYNISSGSSQTIEVTDSSNDILSSLELVIRSENKSDDQFPTCETAIKIFSLLAATDTNRMKMARHNNLLLSLVKYMTTSSDDNPIKDLVKKIVLDLVPFA